MSSAAVVIAYRHTLTMPCFVVGFYNVSPLIHCSNLRSAHVLIIVVFFIIFAADFKQMFKVDC